MDAKFIVSHGISDRTKQAYFHYWQQYVEFCSSNSLLVQFPISDKRIVNYLAHLYMKGYCLSTVASQASALSYLHKLFGHLDFRNSFLVKQFLKGVTNLTTCLPDTRLPITYDTLLEIVKALQRTILLHSERVLFKAMCILAFFGFLRIGEIAAKSKCQAEHVLQQQDVRVIEINNICQGVEITLRKFKHSKRPVTLFLPIHQANAVVCPVQAVQAYQLSRGSRSGPFFQSVNGMPVSYSFFNAHLKNVIVFLGYSPTLYKSHSFRIGAATYAALQGYSDDEIKKMGRWNSNALQHYIRLPRLVHKT